MSAITIGIIALVLFLILMCCGVAIPFSMLFCGAIGIAIIKTPVVASQIVVSELLELFSSYTLTVCPMFGLMGFLACYTGVGSRLCEAINSFLSHRRGGLAMATQVACAGFGAICGSVPATIATMASIAYPEMRARKYMPNLAGSCIAAGAVLAVLIPPSSNFIIYGLATETSIGRLFLSGIIPGIMLTILNMLAVVYIGKRHPDWAPVAEKQSWAKRWNSILHGGLIEVAFVFIISMGGMFAGFFTPTEAGAVGAFGMLLITIITKQNDFKKFIDALMSGARLAAMVFLLLACANIFGTMFTVSGIPTALGKIVTAIDAPRWCIMLVILAIYFLLGLVADLLAMMLVTLPIFFPIVCGTLGYDPIWFGVILTLMIAIGGITPPVGNGIFLVKGSIPPDDKEATISALFSGVWPFVVAAFIAVFILLAFPQVATWLPELVYG
ncbi:MAG: TRAP transporter large permease [Peptococcaceae bacterium]|nr:TRAP transporter large permease [Peptococcaceae bacterium]